MIILQVMWLIMDYEEVEEDDFVEEILLENVVSTSGPVDYSQKKAVNTSLL